jgi:citrate synthase
VHKPTDPRAERILELARERGQEGTHVTIARSLQDDLAPLTMNVSLAIAAVLLDLGFPAAGAKAVPILARTASLLAHLAEEREAPLGFELARAAEEAVDYRAD